MSPPGCAVWRLLHHLLQLVEQLARAHRLIAGTRHCFEPVDQCSRDPCWLWHLAIVCRVRRRQLLRILAAPPRCRACRKLSIAAHISLFIGFLSLFVAGAAVERLAQRFLRLAQEPARPAGVPSSICKRHRPHARTTSRNCVVALGIAQIEEQRAQAEIDAGFRCKTAPAHIASASRAVSTSGLCVGVERQDAALLDQRARQQVCEMRCGEDHNLVARFTAAFIAGFVARDLRSASHRAPASGCSVRSCVVWATPLRARCCGDSDRLICGCIETADALFTASIASLDP